MKLFIVLILFFLKLSSKAFAQNEPHQAFFSTESQKYPSCNPWSGAIFSDQELSQFVENFVSMHDDVGKLYQSLKANFLQSDFCQPSKLFAQSTDQFNPLLLNLFHDRGVIGKALSEAKTSELKIKVLAPYLLPSYALELGRIIELYKQYDQAINDRRIEDAQKIESATQFITLQKMQEQEIANPQIWDRLHKITLVESHVFHLDEQAQPICPFPSEDAFRKAYSGFKKLNDEGKVANPNQLTIVDYTMPFNSRRMFVFELKQEQVLHNTWTAHGGGVNEAGKYGADKLGSSPSTSRVSGDQLTREGFAVFDAEYGSPKYGRALRIKGQDLYNQKMEQDQVWLHKWNPFPGVSYLNDPKYGEQVSQLNILAPNLDFESIDRVYKDLVSAARFRDALATTEGCLGVPENNIKNLDKKGRELSQRDALIEDLPGSVLFSYVGPDQKSKYID